MKISAVVLTKNEEENLEQCLKSLEFCDEIIVVDDYSSDKTIEKVRQVLKVHQVYKVFERKLNGDFAGQRNFGMEKARGEWVLFVDADEIVTDELRKEILRLPFDKLRVAQDNMPEAYCIKRRDWWWGKRELKFGEVMKVREKGIIRLVKKGSGSWLGNVHEVFHTAKNVGTLNGFLDHYPHPTLKEFIEDINRYSSLRAQELYNQGKSTNILEIIFFPLGKFLLNYFLYFGFLDGPAGFAYAFLMSLHSFLVRVKLWRYYFI